jgi:hypothetical protein
MIMEKDPWIYGSAKTRLSYDEYFKASILNIPAIMVCFVTGGLHF